MSKRLKIILRIIVLIAVAVAVYFAIKAFPNPGDRFFGVG
jgi:hypothetical protein